MSLYLLTVNFRSSQNAGFLILTFIAVAIMIVLIALVEMVVLQLVHWGNTRQSMRASLTMNLASSVAGIILLVLYPQPHARNLLFAWFILVAIEGAVLTRIRPGALRYDWFAAVAANLASYILLILPAFLYRG